MVQVWGQAAKPADYRSSSKLFSSLDLPALTQHHAGWPGAPGHPGAHFGQDSTKMGTEVPIRRLMRTQAMIGCKLESMHRGHTHSHNHAHAPLSARALRYSLVATFAYVLITLFAGIKAHSLALLSEAGHNVTDLLALLLSWVAVYIQTRPPSATKTFGYQRAGVLAAFVNALTLVAIAFYIFYEAFVRMRNPVPVHPGIMIWVAVIGVVMNGAISWVLFRAAHDVNIRSAFIHQLG